MVPATFVGRLQVALERSLPRLKPEAAARLREIINPTSLAIIAAVLVAWVGSHAFGIGEAVDIVLAVVGVFSIGLAIFSGLDHFGHFAVGTYDARTDADLDAAAEHFVTAITILGVQAVLALLFRGRPATYRGRPLDIGPPPPRGPGLFYRPKTTGSPTMAAGAGETSVWGDIVYSLRGTANDRALVLLHERIHQILTPKLYFLRNFRVQSRASSYFRSSLRRYLEEALAETAAQVGVNGFRQTFAGLRFPVYEGYVQLTRGGGFAPDMSGRGLLVEGGALIGTGLALGMTFIIWFRPHARPDAAGAH